MKTKFNCYRRPAYYENIPPVAGAGALASGAGAGVPPNENPLGDEDNYSAKSE